MKIQILGKGCPNCKKLEEKVGEATKSFDVEIEKIYDLAEASNMGLMKAPGLAIDGEIKIQGRIPNKAEIKELISNES